MNTTALHPPPPRRNAPMPPPGLSPLPAIPGGALPVLRAAPLHDLLVLTPRPDLIPGHFSRLVRA